MIDAAFICRKGCSCGRGEWCPMFWEAWKPSIANKLSYAFRTLAWDMKIHLKAKTTIGYWASLHWPQTGLDRDDKLRIRKSFASWPYGR